jgi:diacylglycerol kinase (ATP)
MTRVAVIAHSGKAMEGGLGALRDELDRVGQADALWFEVPKSKYVAECVEKAVQAQADVIFVWGGDGTVQRCIDAVAHADRPVAIAILPAGTANLLALNLGIPTTIPEAVATGLDGVRREMDTATVNGEHFAVMAGAGLDALMIRDADGTLKDRLGRAAYLMTGAKNLRSSPVSAEITVDGRRLHKGVITCVIVGNVGKVLGGIDLFAGSRLDDGLVEVGVVTAKSVSQWARTIGRAVVGRPEDSPFITTSRGEKVTVRLDRAIPYELDGGVRDETRKLKFHARRSSVVLCLPVDTPTTLFPTETRAAEPVDVRADEDDSALLASQSSAR